jgi:hypothetical protein
MDHVVQLVADMVCCSKPLLQHFKQGGNCNLQTNHRASAAVAGALSFKDGASLYAWRVHLWFEGGLLLLLLFKDVE